jgi:hypothetical protein
VGAAAAAGVEEAGDGEVEEDQGGAAGDQEVLVGGVVEGGLVQVGAVRPGALGGEEGEEGEEGARHLQPEDAGELDEGAPDRGAEALAALGDAGAGLLNVPLDLNRGAGGGARGGLNRSRGRGGLDGRGLGGCGLGSWLCRRLRGRDQRLGRAACPKTQCSPETDRIHRRSVAVSGGRRKAATAR